MARKARLIKIPKHELKKCKFCNFKKRFCQLNPENCQARRKVCWECKKEGHYPQSICCKKKRSPRRKSQTIKLHREKVAQITRRNKKLILRTIERLEILKELESCESSENLSLEELNSNIEETKRSEENNDNPELKQTLLHCVKQCVFERINYAS